MISRRIKIILCVSIVGVFSFSIYFIPTESLSDENKEKTQKETIEISTAKLPRFIYGVKKMILIPGGTFLMGDENSNFPDERPTHFVTIDSFYMDETPVTNEDFKKYVEAGGVPPRYWRPGYEGYNDPEKPVVGINWYHAVDYCNWRNAIEGISSKEEGYRLPTEAEFEYAARGGLERKNFPWGDEFDPLFANFDDEKGVMKGDWWRLAKVKDTPPNNYGLYGMSGNIWHWISDWYDPSYYARSPKYNPTGPEIGKTKVLRGGSWGSISPEYLRVAKRSYSDPENYNYDIGFRCVRPAKGKILENPTINLNAEYQFYKYPDFSGSKPLKIDVYSEEFINRLAQFIEDNYPNSIYFQTKIDKQEIITPKEMAQLIVKVTKKYNIHPLFLTGVMAAESGFGTVSFPRWYNNPMAYHWQNALMKNGLPTYEPNPSRNRKYINLETGFREFAKGIRRGIYLNAAKKDLYTFHLLYVGYRADEWMYTIARVYNEVLGIKIGPHSPANNIGQYIYTDWNKPKRITPRRRIPRRIMSRKIPRRRIIPRKTTIPNLQNNDLQIVDKFISWGFYIPKQKRTIDTIIIHSAYNALGDDVYSVDGVLYQFKLYNAGPHYLISRDGIIYRLVPEQAIGYHAGTSKMPDGRTNINDFSIGIELLYHKDETPNEIQYRKLVDLVKNLKSKYKIKYILGHKDIAPSRKTDPWNFDWQKLDSKLAE